MDKTKIINFFIGIPTLIVIVFGYSLFTTPDPIDAVSDFFQFFTISVICTAGISLIIWVPLLMLLGTTVVAISNLITGNKQTKLSTDIVSKTTMNPPSSNNELALIGYIVSSRNSKMDDTTIRSNLKSGGWTNQDIDSAFKRSNPEI